jgi:hypothetical protein
VFMPLEDRAEISDLLARYGFALDLRRWDELRDVFAEDAVIHYSGTTEHTGIDDIVTFFRVTASSVAATPAPTVAGASSSAGSLCTPSPGTRASSSCNRSHHSEPRRAGPVGTGGATEARSGGDRG